MPYDNCRYVLACRNVFSVLLLVLVDLSHLNTLIQHNFYPASFCKDFHRCLQSMLGIKFLHTKDNRITTRLLSECAFKNKQTKKISRKTLFKAHCILSPPKQLFFLRETSFLKQK